MAQVTASTAEAPAEGVLTLWNEQELRLVLRWSQDEPVTAELVACEADLGSPRGVQPLVEVLAVGHGHGHMNVRNTATAIGARMRHRSHRRYEDGPWTVVEIEQHDAASGLTCVAELRVAGGGLESRVTVRNDGEDTVWLQALPSLMLATPLGDVPLARSRHLQATSEWVGENRWDLRPLQAQGGLQPLDLARHQHQDSRGASALVSTGGWSSSKHVPAGVLVSQEDDVALAWQIQHNGAWRAELGTRLAADGSEVLVLGLLGPNDLDHGWSKGLAPGASFASVPVGLAVSGAGWQGALAAMTALRRLQRPHEGTRGVIFNDYMNTLMGDPTTEKLLPLIDAAGAAGADWFCIDSGWYDDTGDWWGSVGEWRPSARRFPGGLEEVTAHIRARGMIPGIWLEPESIGVDSPVAERLPAEAFHQRHGVRVVEHGRYLLDFRHPAARTYMDEVVDRLVETYDIGYFKFDHNVVPGAGTDVDADSPGDGLLEHNRAHLTWLEGLLARHRGLVIENCGSGAMRADYAMLSRLHVQSTSDQQNPLLYPPIAAGALLSILPEQAANWAYPQASMTLEEIAFTMCTGLAGRLQLSGHLDRMDQERLALVHEAVRLAHSWEARLEDAVPFWPLGPAGWEEPWVVVGLRSAAETLLVVWSRGDGTGGVDLPAPAGEVEVLYPRETVLAEWRVERPETGRLALATTTAEPQARILRITPTEQPTTEPPGR